MNKTLTLAAIGGAMLASATMLVPAPADAAIQCKGRHQWNTAANAWISSPYCEDKLIAQVAGYSFQAIRTSPNLKAEACRFAGSDMRIRDLCAGHLPEDQGRNRR